jgi:hypothetical protein
MRGETVQGRAEFTAFTETYFRAFPDVRLEVIGPPYLPLKGTRLAVRSRMTGTVTRPINSGAAPKTALLLSCDVYRGGRWLLRWVSRV